MTEKLDPNGAPESAGAGTPPPALDRDRSYPVDVGAEIDRRAKLDAATEMLWDRMHEGEDLPPKQKLVWTAEELAGEAQTADARGAAGATPKGRTRGPQLLKSGKRIIESFEKLRIENGGRTPTWSSVALDLLVSERTLRRARKTYGVDKQLVD
jgi:hypothetical protein